jgi:hypothetical protein
VLLRASTTPTPRQRPRSGGTIWRLDPDGKDVSLVAAGFRNQYDAAFSPSGELFTFDSDMEGTRAAVVSGGRLPPPAR